tara:strand:- start:640 stop:2376 length:1737 start_codon:yes stop_codon:yes gene_type:complete
MSKVSRKKLSRGVVLGTEHVFQPLTDIGTSVSIDAEQLMVKWSPFRLNFSVPVINVGTSVADAHFSGRHAFCIPFMVPPLQGYFESDQKTRNNTPQVILDELSFSFDTRGEAAAIRMREGPNSADNNIDSDGVKRLNVDISIVEKSTYFSGNTSSNIPTREVESVRLDSILFKDTTERFNPFIVDGLNKPLDPYKSYLLKIFAKDLWSGREYDSSAVPPVVTDTERDAPMFVSVNVSLKLRHPIVTKTDKDESQNAPNVNPSIKNLSISTPATSDQITADQPNGISVEMKKLDDLIHEGLDGGSGKDSIPVEHNHISQTAGYEIIAVPMWGNYSRYQTVSSLNASELPYSTVSTCDRRVIPINYPIIIHHVIAGVNYHDVFGASPINPNTNSMAGHFLGRPHATFGHTIGVAIGTGLRSDEFTYQQVAHHAWLNDDSAGTPKTLKLIDKIESDSGDTSLDWDHELISVPIISSVAPGKGFSPQGQPFYAGKGAGVDISGATNLRNGCGNPSAQSNTNGGEQFIEIRWQMADFTPGSDNSLGSSNTTLTGKELYIGTGGHWVYLICEKLLAGGDGDLKL